MPTAKLSSCSKSRHRRTVPRKSTRAVAPPSLLADLGVIGMETIEPVVLAALISGEPLLLIGPHGTGKSYLLSRICEALGLRWRHYNASLLNFDDLVGYPLPTDSGGLRYIQTPSSVWDAEAVFIDEISRCRPDLQNKLFPIIHERRVQGIKLEQLVYRWSAMNPPHTDEDEDHTDYIGSEPLDPALADRFAFVVQMPDWSEFGRVQQKRLILLADAPLAGDAAARLRNVVESGRSLFQTIKQQMAEELSEYVQAVAAILRSCGIVLSGRRGGVLLRNIVAVHTARLQCESRPKPADSALLALLHSIPDAATGLEVKRPNLIAAHREAWKVCGLRPDSPQKLLLLETDPLRRLRLAIRHANAIAKPEFSCLVTDALIQLPDGARHAVLVELFETGAAGRLVAAVADQWAAQYAVVATPQELHMHVIGNGIRHLVWQRIAFLLSRMDPAESDTPLVTNLLAGLFAEGSLNDESDVASVLREWQTTRLLVKGMCQ